MNYCTKCASYYQNPGTCNCYAPAKITWPMTPYVGPYCWQCQTYGYCNCKSPWTITGGSTGTSDFSSITFTIMPTSCTMSGCDGKCGICKKDEPPPPGTPCEGPHGEDA